jgi:acyl-CoA reductase-like NAD-dependent aldehyde dehydrogenase
MGMLIAGKLCEGAGAIDVENPSTGEICASVPAATSKQLEQAIDAAVDAASWSEDEEQRRGTLRAMAEVVGSHSEELARLLSLEIGLPSKVAQDEVSAACMFLRYRAETPLPRDLVYDDARQRVEVVRRPIGVIGAIIPWNAPLLIACEKIATAFAAGNAVVMKPSPLAPLALLRLGELCAGVVPPGMLNVLPGGADLGAELVGHPQVGMISFTGSIRAGQAIMAAAAPGLKRLSLELGGNDAAIVLPDIDVAKVAPRLFAGAFYRGGQICAAIKRLYVHRDVAGELTEALKALAEACILGDPFDATTTMGPISNRQQFEIVENLVAAAKAHGGTVVCGGSALDRPGYFFRPTLITRVEESNPLVQEEQFGPALPIVEVADADEAVERANATRFGLGGSVWATDTDAATRIAAKLRCGSAWVNRHGLVQPDVPFGGMKLSGIGRANGGIGLDSYAELQTVSVAKPR